MSNGIAWLMVLATVLLTTYGQLVLKWQVTTSAPAPFQMAANWPPIVLLLLRPWVVSAFLAAFAASLCWMMAMSKLELGRAYPFMALNFLLVCLLAVPLFGESMNVTKLIGLVMIVVGLVVISQG